MENNNKTISETSKEIGQILIRHEQTICNPDVIDGKKAVALIMAINDIEQIIEREIRLALNGNNY